jgi:hypothetical protein
LKRLSVPNARDRGRNPSAKAHKGRRALDIPHLHDMGLAEQAAEDRLIPHILARNRDQTHSRGLMVKDANGHLIGDNGGNGLRIHLAGDGDHVQPHRADSSHRFQLFQGEMAASDGLRKVQVLTHRDKGAGEAAN